MYYDAYNSLKWWAFEIVTLMAGRLPNPQLETSVLSIWYVYIYKKHTLKLLLYIECITNSKLILPPPIRKDYPLHKLKKL